MVLVGYELGQKAYKLGNVIHAKQLQQEMLKLLRICQNKQQSSLKMEDSDSSVQNETEEIFQDTELTQQDVELIALRTWRKQLHKASDDDMENNCQTAALLTDGIPTTYEETINSSTSKQWEVAMTDEFKSLTIWQLGFSRSSN